MGKNKQEDRREYRRRRRIRNQILAYLTLILLLALIIYGGFQLIRLATAGMKQQQQNAPVTETEAEPTPEEAGVISTPDPIEEFTEPSPTPE